MLLESLEPLCTPEEFIKYKDGVRELEATIGNKLQRILYVKSWLAPNFVSDWWYVVSILYIYSLLHIYF